METIYRLASRPQAKPYRTRNLKYDGQIHLDENGLLKFGLDDVENPKQWTRARRWYITVVTIILVMNASMSSSSPSGCLPSISEDLGVSEEVAKLTVSFFLLGFCSGPCLWAPLSEYYGRKLIFTSTFICYFGFTFLCAFTPNIAGLLVGRFLCGTFVGGVLSNAPGIFADLWGPVERQNCMTLFTCGLQMGPAIGPLTSGFYQLKLDWRWNVYQLLWLGGFSLLLLPTIPETLPSRALLAKAKRIRRAQIPGYENVQAPIEVENRHLLAIFKVALLRPWQIAIDPISALIAVYITVVYALLYMLFTIFPIVFIEKRGWNSGVGELPLLSICIGAVFAGIYIYWDSDRQRKRIANGHKHAPEVSSLTPLLFRVADCKTKDTLPIAMTGAILLPVSMFWLAWSGEYNSVHWIVPTLAGVILSIAICVLFMAFLSYLSESYLMYAASAQAANQIIRSAVAAGAPLYTQQMFNRLGVAGGGSLIGGIAILLMPIPFVFYKYGARIRLKSKFAPTEGSEESIATSSDRKMDQNQTEYPVEEEKARNPAASEAVEDKISDVESDDGGNHSAIASFDRSSDIEKN